MTFGASFGIIYKETMEKGSDMRQPFKVSYSFQKNVARANRPEQWITRDVSATVWSTTLSEARRYMRGRYGADITINNIIPIWT